MTFPRKQSGFLHESVVDQLAQLLMRAVGDRAIVRVLGAVRLSPLRYDREVKVPLYARHGVPAVWMVDLQKGRVVCYRSPRDGKYRSRTPAAAFSKTRVEGLPDVEIDLSRLLA